MIFERVIVGVNGTRESYEAARQAVRLTRPGGTVRLIAAADPYLAVLNRWGPGRLVNEGETSPIGVQALATERLAPRAWGTLAAVRATLPTAFAVTQEVVEGRPWEVLRELAEADDADLVVLGSHGGGRLIGAMRESTATELLHDAPCSVMVARSCFDGARFPARTIVGVDGSESSLAGLDVAKAIAVADGGRDVTALVVPHPGLEIGTLRRAATPLGLVTRGGRVVDALVEAAAEADLLVLGARGTSGLRSLGSVSERVAHRAHSSVLIVRR